MDIPFGHPPQYLALSAAVFPVATAMWFAYFRAKGWSARENAWFGIVAVLAGFGSVFLGYAGYLAFEHAGLVVDWSALELGSLHRSFAMALVIGVIEEGAKVVPLFVLALLLRRKIRSHHILLVAALIGVGFAAGESSLMLWWGQLSMRDALARAAAAPVTHALFAAPWGFGIALWLRRGQRLPIVYGAAVSVLTHAAYDWVLARPELPNLLASAIVLALWAWLISQTAEPRRRIALGGDAGAPFASAPIVRALR